jgi:hypothetical protein
MATPRKWFTARSTRAAIAFLSMRALAAFSVAGCVESAGASHVRAGDLYAPGQDRYDDYFASVHSQQATAAQWPGDRKAAHQPLLTALKLDGDPTDSALEQSTRTAKAGSHGRALGQAIDQAVRADVDRAKGLEAMATKIDEILKTGHDLEAHVSEDFRRPSRPSAAEVKGEIRASFEVLAAIRDHATHEAKAAEDFVAELAKPGTSAKHSAAGKGSPGPSGSSGASSSASSTGAPKPQPKPASTGEVFQP